MPDGLLARSVHAFLGHAPSGCGRHGTSGRQRRRCCAAAHASTATHRLYRDLLECTGITCGLDRSQADGWLLYTPENYYPGRFEIKNTFRVVELALDQIEHNSHAIELALNGSDIERINKSGKIAAFLDLEGGYDLRGDLHLLRALYRLGLRSMRLTAHNTTNAFIEACNDVYTWGGINDHGKAVIKEMNDLGMVINVAHASNDAITQSVAASRHPVVYSHGGFSQR